MKNILLSRSLAPISAFFFFPFISALLPAPSHCASAPPPTIVPRAAITWGGASDEVIFNVAADPQGNTYAAGQFSGTADLDPGPTTVSCTSNGLADIFICKFSPSGALLWVKAFGGSDRDAPNGFAVDPQGNSYIAGSFRNSVDFNPDPAIADMHSSNAGAENNIFLCKFSPLGALVWARTWGPSDGGAEAYSVTLDVLGHIYVQGDFSGTTTNFNPWDKAHPDWHANHAGQGAAFDAFLSKFDLDGNFIYARTWGGEGYDDGPGVVADSQGNVYIAGMYASTNINFDPAGGNAGTGHPAHDSGSIVDVFFCKYDAGGNFQWVRTWGGQGTEDAGHTVLVDRAGDVYVVGRYASLNCDFNPGGAPDIHSTNGDRDIFLAKYDPSGNFKWARTWGAAGWDTPNGLAVDESNNVYVTGWFFGAVDFDLADGKIELTSNGDSDIFLVKFNPSGDLQWATSWGGTKTDRGFRLAWSGPNLYLAGSIQDTVSFGVPVGSRISNGSSDALILKLRASENAVGQKVWRLY